MLHQRTLLPSGGFGIIAGREMRTADPDQIVESERVLRREVERDLETFDGGFGVASIGIDPTAAAPRPRRSPVKRERLADNQVRGIEFVEQCEGVAEDGKHGGIAGKRPRLLRQFDAAGALLPRFGGKMIDHALNVSPGRKRCREGVVRVLFHRAVEQFDRARISLGVERQHARHRPEREVVRTEVIARFSQRVIDLRNAKV